MGVKSSLLAELPTLGEYVFLSHQNSQKKIKVINSIQDIEGRMVGVEIEYENQTYDLVNIYGHNRDNPEYFELLSEKLEESTATNIIIGGDFNLVLDLEKDCKNRTDSQPNARKCLKELIENFNLEDIWRIKNSPVMG